MRSNRKQVRFFVRGMGAELRRGSEDGGPRVVNPAPKGEGDNRPLDESSSRLLCHFYEWRKQKVSIRLYWIPTNPCVPCLRLYPLVGLTWC